MIQDHDQSFTTGALPKDFDSWKIVTRQPLSEPQQPGIELLNSSTGYKSQAVISTLEGKIIWTFEMPDRLSFWKTHRLYHRNAVLNRFAAWFGLKLHKGPIPDRLAALARQQAATPVLQTISKSSKMSFIYPIKPLPDGNFLVLYGLSSQVLLDGPAPPGTFSCLREITPAGDTVREITVDELNQKLKQSGHPEMHLQTFHHDVTILPNGHWVVIANEFRPGSDPGPGQTDVFGDVLIDLDEHLNPVWTWSSFQHLSMSRSPIWFPDWTHANAVLYSPDDGNLLLSLRNQSWILKIDYRNGKGNGAILWRLGHEGDFKLLHGSDPQDWQYAQHQPSFVGSKTAGHFFLSLMDNGNGRVLSNGTHCIEPPAKGNGTNCYTTVPVFEVDEKEMTVKVVNRKALPPEMYSSWGGDAVPLANGHLEATLSSQGNEGKPGKDAAILELSQTSEMPVLWEMDLLGTPIYRAQRLSSPYPGVAW